MPGALTDYFNKEFNRRLGTPTGQPIVSHTMQGRPQPFSAVRHGESGREVMRKISSGRYDLPTNAEKAYESVFGEKSTEGGDPFAGWQRKEERRGERRLGKAKQEYQEANKVLEENARVDDAIRGIEEKSGGWKGLLSSFDESPVGRALDVIGRIPSAGFEAGAEWIRSTKPESAGGEGKAGDWKPWWIDAITALDDASHGAALGLMGKKKSGAGAAVDTAIPNAPYGVRLGLSILGEGVGDPYNLFTGGTAKVLREGGNIASKASTAATVERSVSRAINKGVAGGHLGLPTRINAPGGKFINPLEGTRRAAATRARTLSDKISLQIKGGGLRQRLNVGGKRKYAATVAAGTAEEYRGLRLATYHKYVDQYRAHLDDLANGGPGTLTPTQITRMERADPFFKTHVADWRVASRGKGKKSWVKISDDTADGIRASLDKEVEWLSESMMDDLADFYYTAPGVRVLNKTIPFRRVGKMIDTGAAKLGSRADVQYIMKHLSYEQKFPGRLSLLSQRVKSIGLKNFDNYAKVVREKASQVSEVDARRITDYIENNKIFHGEPQLEAMKDWVKDEYKKMFFREQKAGVRHGKDVLVDNYTYLWHKKGGKNVINDFKKNRKHTVKTHGTTAGFQTANAKKLGLKPVENAFEALLYREMKSNRDMTKGWFLADLLDNYGFMGKKLGHDAAERRGLKAISGERLGLTHTTAMAKRGNTFLDEWYLPKEIAEVFDEYENLARFDADNKFIRVVRKITQMFKSSVTVYMPGYHVRNMVSDMFMGVLDGVNMKAYWEVIRKSKLYRDTAAGEKFPRFHPNPKSTYKIGPGVELNGPELWNLYRENAASGGYTAADIAPGRGTGSKFTTKVGEEVSRAKQYVQRSVRGASEGREDFGRVVHFLHALRDEFNGPKPHQWDKTVEEAVYRVNHYKFDYGALTKTEQQWVKLAFPFYTFTRKALPTLTESLFLSPKNLSRVDRFQEQHDGSGAEFFNHAYIPEFMREIGFASITDEEQPLMLTQDILPQSVFSNIQPYPFDADDIARNVLKQTNPLAQIPIELATGRKLFNEQEVGPYPTYSAEKFGPFKEAKELWDAHQRGDPLWETIAQSRLVGPGLPLRRATTGQQEFQKFKWEDMLIDDPFKRFNEGQGDKKGVRVYTSKRAEGSSYQVKDAMTGKVIFDTTDPEEALNYAKEARGNSLPMSLEEFNDGPGQSSNVRVYLSNRKAKRGNGRVESYRVKNTKTDKVIKDFKTAEEAYNYARGL